LELQLVVRAESFLKISVKGSQDGAWGLTQSRLSNADYHAAADLWLTRHTQRTVLCFVQFKDVPGNALPRMYLATPVEVAKHLKGCVKGRGDTILYERHVWGPRAHAAGTIEEIPAVWSFTRERVAELFGAA
jgi:hypothetical protein